MSIKLYTKPIIIALYLCLLAFIQLPVTAIESNEFMFNKALNLIGEGNYLEANRVWDKYILLYPDDPAAYSNRGNIRLILGDPQGDIYDQNKSLEILPNQIDPHLNRGIAEETLKKWDDAKADYQWIIDREPNNSSAIYNLGNVMGALGDWTKAEFLFNKASIERPSFVMARVSKALANYQLGKVDIAESELRSLIRKYPMFADARAALTAILWHKGFSGEAESNWIAVEGLDSRYSQKDWLVNIRRWPSEPTQDLVAFIEIKSP